MLMHLYTHTRTHTRHTRGDILCCIVWNSVAITCLRRAPCPPFLPLFESRAMRSVLQGPTQNCRMRGEERKREEEISRRAAISVEFLFPSFPFLSFPSPLSLSLSLSLAFSGFNSGAAVSVSSIITSPSLTRCSAATADGSGRFLLRHVSFPPLSPSSSAPHLSASAIHTHAHT